MGTSKVGAISKAQKARSLGPFDFLKIQFVAKYQKKLKGDPMKIEKFFLEKFSKKNEK